MAVAVMGAQCVCNSLPEILLLIAYQMRWILPMMQVSEGGAKGGDTNCKAMNPIEFRNVARYVQDVEANLPLYQALGFEVLQQMGTGMAILKNAAGLKLVLHSWDDHQGKHLDTALGFTITGSVEEARAYVEKAGFRLLREPDAEDPDSSTSMPISTAIPSTWLASDQVPSQGAVVNRFDLTQFVIAHFCQGILGGGVVFDQSDFQAHG